MVPASATSRLVIRHPSSAIARLSIILARGDGVNESLKGGSRFANQVFVARPMVDGTTKHHTVVRPVGHREADIRDTHRVEPADAARLPRVEQSFREEAKSLRRH